MRTRLDAPWLASPHLPPHPLLLPPSTVFSVKNSSTAVAMTILTHVVSLLAGALLLAPAVGSVKKANILFLMCDSMDGRVLDPTSPGSDE